MKGKRRRKRSRTKQPKRGFGGTRNLTRSEVEWLNKDSTKTLKRAEELPPALMADTPLVSNLPEGSVKKEDLLKAERFGRQLGVAKAVKITVQSALHGDE